MNNYGLGKKKNYFKMNLFILDLLMIIPLNFESHIFFLKEQKK